MIGIPIRLVVALIALRDGSANARRFVGVPE
jgi:hypothetical protein